MKKRTIKVYLTKSAVENVDIGDFLQYITDYYPEIIIAYLDECGRTDDGEEEVTGFDFADD